MKAFAFRFNWKRDCALLLFAATLFIFAYSHEALAATNPAALANCEKQLSQGFSVIENLHDEKTVDPSKIDQNLVRNYCAKNISSHLNQKNGDTNSQHYENDGRATDDHNGACQLSYWEMLNHFKRMKDAYHGYCEKVAEAQEVGENCAKKNSIQSPEDCLKDLTDKQKEATDIFEKIKENYLEKAAQALKPRKDMNVELKNIFRTDANTFKTELTVSSAPDHYPGSKGFADIYEYKEYVAPDAPVANLKSARQRNADGLLIEEQDLAADNVENYLKKVDEFKTKGDALAKSLNSYSDNIRKRIDKSSPTDKFGTAAAVAPAGLAALNQPKTPAVAAAAVTPSVSGAASAALPFAALGMAAASRSGSSTSGSAASPTLPTGPAAPAAPIASTGFGGDRSPAGAGTHVSDALKASEEKKTDSTPVVAAVANPFSADGASRAVAIKRVSKNEGGDGAPRAAENFANTSDAGIIPLGGFHPPSRPSSSPANEVTNLLGQMKSLFNFDEPAGGGGSSGATFGGGAPNMGGVLPSPGAGGVVAASEDGAAPEVPATAPGVTQEEGSINSEGLSNQSDSLFVRVHKRHERYQQRGLLVVNLGGIRQ
ncbi:MAG: hypothetical protein ACXWQO_10065 [Bdellovibrionota bacterium]